jgi:peptidoglycan/LPS O-acetylase OafA/YrhL
MNARNCELDRLRAFAVIMTLVIHYARVYFPWIKSFDYQHGAGILNIWANCWTGVDLFFVISGYIITKTIISKIDELKGSIIDLALYIKGFYIKRIYRIYPVAWLVFMITLVCSILFNQSGSFSKPENIIEAGISIFTYTFNYYLAYGFYKYFDISSYWSLAVEDQFYLLLPFFYIFTKNNKQRVIILLSILFFITFISRPFITEDNFLLTQNRCDGLIYGCLIYFITQQKWFSVLVSQNDGSRYLRIVGVTLLVLVLAAVPAMGFSNKIVIPLACLVSSIPVAFHI